MLNLIKCCKGLRPDVPQKFLFNFMCVYIYCSEPSIVPLIFELKQIEN